VVGK